MYSLSVGRMREAAREKELQRVAVEEAEKKYAHATAEMKAQYEQELTEARQKLVDATTRELTIVFARLVFISVHGLHAAQWQRIIATDAAP